MARRMETNSSAGHPRLGARRCDVAEHFQGTMLTNLRFRQQAKIAVGYNRHNEWIEMITVPELPHVWAAAEESPRHDCTNK
jgi:hypothetical protein